jgi:hypothetical protein
MATPDNLPLRDLQKIILGEREEPMSVIEIKNLFSYPTTPESILYIITALNRNKIDPNTTLLQGIDSANHKEDLVPIALSLKYGADPNLYVNFPNVGDIHILAFVYLIVSNKTLPLLNSIVIMLIAMGSDPNRLVFDSKGGIIRDEYSLVEPVKGQSVLGWLEEHGYDTIIPQIEGQKYDDVESNFMTTLATFLDNPELIPAGNMPRLDEILGSHSVEVFNRYVDDVDPKKGILLSKKYLNLDSYERFVDLGGVLNYEEINGLIISAKKHKDLGDIISTGQIREMLLYSISRGSILDKYQMDLIKEIDSKFYQKILDGYSQPYWVKACATNKGIPDARLKRLAYQLNLYPEAPKDSLCNQIKMITQADPDLVKKSTVTRQQIRIRSDVAYINQFDNGENTPDIKCNNRSLLSDNLYDYPDADIAYYRDYQDSLWCFTSNNYVKMVDKKVNPYTKQPFPSWFLDEIKRKIEFISTYRDIDSDPIPISNTIDSLRQPDIPDNLYTENIVRKFNQMLSDHDIIEWNISSLSKDEMKDILTNNFKIQSNLDDISKDHAEKTFANISYEQLSANPDSADEFFKEIKEKSVKTNEK